MTKTISNIGLRIATTLVVLLSATSAYSQPDGRFYVPFQFHLGNILLPAGDYIINIDPACGRIKVSSPSGWATMFLSANEPIRSAKSAKTGQLVFHRYGNVYTLHRLWRYGTTAGYELPVSKFEREIAKKAGTPSVTEIASLSVRPRS